MNKNQVFYVSFAIGFLLLVYLYSLLCHYDIQSGYCDVKERALFLTQLLPFVAGIGIIIGICVYYVFDKENSIKSSKTKVKSLMLSFLPYYERVVVEFLFLKKKALQSEITRLKGMNKLRAHRAVKSLSKKGLINVMRVGKTNMVVLKKEISSLFD